MKRIRPRELLVDASREIRQLVVGAVHAAAQLVPVGAIELQVVVDLRHHLFLAHAVGRQLAHVRHASVGFDDLLFETLSILVDFVFYLRIQQRYLSNQAKERRFQVSKETFLFFLFCFSSRYK